MKSFRTFLDTFSLKYPIIQAPMAGISTIDMSVKVYKYGGMGSIPFGSSLSNPDKIHQDLQEFKTKTDSNNVNINFFAHDIDDVVTDKMMENYLKLYGFKGTLKNGNISFKQFETSPNFEGFLSKIIDIGPKVISFHFGIPSIDTLNTLRSNGIKIFATATSVPEVKQLLPLVDGIVLQGYEAGGHRGDFLPPDEKLSTWALFDQVKRLDPNTFIIVAGGIVNSSDIQKYLDNGASAVQLGTAFVTTKESNGNIDFISNSDEDTIMTDVISGKNARCIKTKFIEETINKKDGILPPYGYLYYGYKTWKLSQPPEKGFYLVGSNYKLAKHGLSVDEVMDNLTKDLSL